MQSSAHLGEALSFVSAHRFGASLEVPDTLGFGSSLSLRSSSRVGSSMSVLGVVFLAFSLSVLDCCTARTSLALKGWARLGSSLSVDRFDLLPLYALRSVTVLLWSRPDGFVAVCVEQCFLRIVSLFSQFRSTRCVFICTGGTILRELGRWFGNVVSKRILLGIVAVAFGFVAVRCFSSVAHFLQARPWVLFIIEGFFSRLGDSLSSFGSARYGASLAVLGHTPGFVSIASLWSAIGRVAFRLIFLPDRVLDGIAELLPRREISLGSNLLPMALRRWSQVCRFGISRLADRRCPCSAYHDSPHPYL